MTMNMVPTSFLYVLSVYEQGSISKAAKALGVSQPAVSTGINQIEQKLGYAVFDRSVNPIRLTAEGELFLEYLQKDRQMLEDCIQKINDLHQAGDGSMNIGAPAAYLDHVVLTALPDYLKEYPDAKLNLVNASVPELIGETISGAIDGFVCADPTLPQELEALALRKEHIYVCFPKEWGITGIPEGKGAIKELLDGRPIISLNDNQPLQRIAEPIIEELELELKRSVTVNQLTTCMRLIGSGAGMGILTEDALKTDPYIEDNITAFRLNSPKAERNIVFVRPKNRYHGPAQELLVRLLSRKPEEL